jgi:arsenate reductase
MLLKKAKLSPRKVLRTKEDPYKQLGLANTSLTGDELIQAMVKYPDLIQRPLVEQGEKVLLARPADKVRDLL